MDTGFVAAALLAPPISVTSGQTYSAASTAIGADKLVTALTATTYTALTRIFIVNTTENAVRAYLRHKRKGATSSPADSIIHYEEVAEYSVIDVLPARSMLSAITLSPGDVLQFTASATGVFLKVYGVAQSI